jgi:hypothetical protein
MNRGSMERFPPKVLNPLAIIFVFFSFTEVMLGYAVFNTSGNVQVALTAFVIAFPTLAASGFFVFLWFRPQHLYAPKDYGSDESYLKSMAEARNDRNGLVRLESEIEKIITAKLTSQEFVASVANASNEQVGYVLREAAADVSTRIRDQQFLTVTFEQFDPKVPDMIVPFDAFPTFSDLTDEVYFKLSPKIKPYHYGNQWVLRDSSNGMVLKSARMVANFPPGRPMQDRRSLEELGVRPGSRLIVTRPNGSPAG